MLPTWSSPLATSRLAGSPSEGSTKSPPPQAAATVHRVTAQTRRARGGRMDLISARSRERLPAEGAATQEIVVLLLIGWGEAAIPLRQLLERKGPLLFKGSELALDVG